MPAISGRAQDWASYQRSPSSAMQIQLITSFVNGPAKSRTPWRASDPTHTFVKGLQRFDVPHIGSDNQRVGAASAAIWS